MAPDSPEIRLLALSTTMLEAAEQGDWEEVERLDGERLALADKVRSTAKVSKAIELGKKATALASKARADVAGRLSALQRGQSAAAAYNSEAGDER